MKKVLVVDDDANILELCREVLTREGFRVLEAEDVPSAITTARTELPDLVLLDWMLPGVDGMEALRALKASARTRHIPVVMLTALDGLTEITIATYQGADGYVTKPFEIEDLLAVVRRFSEDSEPQAS
jgi:DNA-binding response OmpR family regulator